MSGYQIADDEESDYVREGQFSESSLKDKLLETFRSGMGSHPKIVCLTIFILLVLIIHWFLAILPSLIFWLILLSGGLLALKYSANYLPDVIRERIPWIANDAT
ncbi:hypothetical protein GUITHDRAFT_105025 [Guillardia theta CCMP2712]|uniref:Uncharacterized protein n=1 Tax=Guillardia theta (strain CCMP2712) TaxID=905079 RepID=L1JLR6_GUITC|nr:hypothetical protein GUITHDRAFT_105025 [Guillardia theta CCMP2712]EKX49501.1 hypothetical protein GUITHDRAFT_105025 [Guillardia theta CCMP2712]|mmetsp:Transcript_25671/g.84760  ORF Transcript_25671/g.84760 Transcript_25671/m.84760 type:complete len:104 (-) Transcript_25671:102-413(-)|eukprot:XP_005836481.1 hypothetical protein GUITHDRAFT_105025 [Guillardia theta CCMP2712]